MTVIQDSRAFATPLKPFQADAVRNAETILGGCLSALEMIKDSPTADADRARVIADQGAILFEAPTGTGKTLMLGHVVSALSRKAKIIWLWFAPFSGLVDQAARTIRTEFAGVRQCDALFDREADNASSGDVYVMSWASVAVADADSRKVRSTSETKPSLDDFIASVRRKGFHIGVVVDEAHHTFRRQTKALSFYREILAPEVTIMATATPRDADIADFCKVYGIPRLRRTSISRQQGVDAGLIKRGVKVAVFKVGADVAKLVDFRKTALRQGVALHLKLKELLSAYGVVPLLLVQVDSTDGTIEETKAHLKTLGFNDDKVRVHTTEEPDPALIDIAADENVEVLIFKMAIATGFDVPRGFTLVSFRTARDVDFGVQVVGRILRVDRRLQGKEALPEALDYGYVFLADRDAQTGLADAALRINAIRDELASVGANVAVAVIGDQPAAAVPVPKSGQLPLIVPAEKGSSAEMIDAGEEKLVAGIQSELLDDWKLDFTPKPEPTAATPPSVAEPAIRTGIFTYPLRTDTKAPANFLRAVVSLDQEALLSDIVGRFDFTDELLLKAQQTAVQIVMEEVEIFGNRKDSPETIRADLAQHEVDAMAQRALIAADDLEVIDTRELNLCLVAAFRRAVEARGIDVFDTEGKLLMGLNKILALRPAHLKRAISEAVSRHTVAEDAAPIPAAITGFAALEPARLNLYRVFPDDLNSWERAFAEYLDDDTTGTVEWWHRNPPRKPYSVGIPLPGQPDFYPDFIVGVKDRKRGNGILLAETKRDINDEPGNAQEKAQVEHPTYRKVMMLYWQDSQQWVTVEYDEAHDKNELDRILRPELMTAY